jgi:hypothetical protein
MFEEKANRSGNAKDRPTNSQQGVEYEPPRTQIGVLAIDIIELPQIAGRSWRPKLGNCGDILPPLGFAAILPVAFQRCAQITTTLGLIP